MWLLGYAGVIPFLVLFIVLYRGKPTFFDMPIPLSLWLGIYAAIILSFLGAVSWGVALAMQTQITTQLKNRLLVYSVIPSLLGWFSLLLPINIALTVMSGLIVLAYLADLKMLSPHISSHYLRLRFHLSITVATLLVLSSLFV